MKNGGNGISKVGRPPYLDADDLHSLNKEMTESSEGIASLTPYDFKKKTMEKVASKNGNLTTGKMHRTSQAIREESRGTNSRKCRYPVQENQRWKICVITYRFVAWSIL